MRDPGDHEVTPGKTSAIPHVKGLLMQKAWASFHLHLLFILLFHGFGQVCHLYGHMPEVMELLRSQPGPPDVSGLLDPCLPGMLG